MRPSLHALLAALALTPLPGCRNVSPHATSFASEPPGARVLLDGRDSGWVTPCLIALAADEDHRVTLELPGHAPSTLLLRPFQRRHVVDWVLGAGGLASTLHFPILLPPEDLLVPLRDERALTPGRVFVRLRPESTP